VIYVDSSVLLAQLFAEDRRPPPTLWDEPLIASRLAEYEVWNRLHARHLAGSHGDVRRAHGPCGDPDVDSPRAAHRGIAGAMTRLPALRRRFRTKRATCRCPPA